MIDTKEHGGRNPLVDAAQKISITGGDVAEGDDIQVDGRTLDEVRGERVARGGLAVVKDGVVEENTIPAGSFEALMNAFGRGQPDGGGMKPVPPPGGGR